MVVMTDRPHEPVETFALPLFPLNLVLYPGMMLPLHIFEERYQVMIGECFDQKKPFGVILIKAGQEVGGSAVPVSIGTTAHILDVQGLGGGRMNILTRGEQRFEVHKIIQSSPHLIAEVAYLPDEIDAQDDEQAAAVVARLRTDYSALLERMASLAPEPDGDLQVPAEAAALSYAIASKLATSIRFPTGIRQQWLEYAGVYERLGELGEVLDKVNKILAEEIVKSRADDLLLN
jgi:Lon protease-like protein